VELGFHSYKGLHSYKAGTLLLEPQVQSILLWLFWRYKNYLLGLASDQGPLDLSLPSSVSSFLNNLEGPAGQKLEFKAKVAGLD
jgi:hypothetical protein